MELVSGLTLAEWLERRPQVVTTEELGLRLRLFRTICEGVNYAHQRTLIANATLARAVAARGDAREAEELFASVFDAPAGTIPELYLTDAHRHYGAILDRAGRYAAAEAQLLAAEKALREPRGGAVRARTAVLEALVDLYSAWDAAAPGRRLRLS